MNDFMGLASLGMTSGDSVIYLSDNKKINFEQQKSQMIDRSQSSWLLGSITEKPNLFETTSAHHIFFLKYCQ